MFLTQSHARSVARKPSKASSYRDAIECMAIIGVSDSEAAG